MRDLDVQGLDETMVLTPGILKQHTSKQIKNKNIDTISEGKAQNSSASLKDQGNEFKIMSNATLLGDDAIFFLQNNEILKMDITHGKTNENKLFLATYEKKIINNS